MSSRVPPEAVAAGRTWLFVPGDRPERFGRAAASEADCVVLDLEDAVGADRKDAARTSVVGYLRHGGTAWVRVTAAGLPGHDADMAALRGAPGLSGVMLAKAEPGQAAPLAAALGVGVLALVESAIGILGAIAIAGEPGVLRLAFGSLDYALDVGAEHADEALLLARSTLVLASRAAALPGPVDGVTTSLADLELVRADAVRARRLGMTGKLLIHPRQVAPALAGLRPDVGQVAWARRVLAAVPDVAAAAAGGEMVDAPVLARARAVLAAAGDVAPVETPRVNC